MTSNLLKLRAEDEDDLKVIAACLQDALVPIGDVDFRVDERRFVLVANRFRWEAALRSTEGYERVHCGLVFDQVRRVRLRNIDRRERDLILCLLSIEPVATGEAKAIDLIWAADRAIRLEVDAINVHMEDFGEPWPTFRRPEHPLAGAEP